MPIEHSDGPNGEFEQKAQWETIKKKIVKVCDITLVAAVLLKSSLSPLDECMEWILMC